MNPRGLPVPLDRRLPFVSAVVDVIEGRGDISTAIEVLTAAEERCRVAIWWDLAGHESNLGAGCFVPLNSGAPPSLCETQELLRRPWEEFERVFRSASDEDAGSKAVDEGLVRLLGETHLILSGMDFCNETFVRAPEGTVAAWTQRAWGAFLAHWANDTGWGPHFNKKGHRYSWSYMNFYHLGDETLEQYTRWQEVLHDVLREKTLRALEE